MMFLKRPVLCLLSGLLAFLVVSAGVGAAPADSPTEIFVPSHYTVERVVMVYRHGLRAPLNGEIGARAYATDAWPEWATPNAELTPHGREGLRLMGLYDRGLFTHLGLFPEKGCPAADQLSVYTDSDSRSMASGDELREGMAPGCQIRTRHVTPDMADLTFTAGAAGSAPFNGEMAQASIRAYIGNQQDMIAPYLHAVRILENILGCRKSGASAGCDLAQIPSVLSADDSGLHVRGPVLVMSGTAEVFLLQYAEGMPMADVGWGRATLADLTAISALHGQLFDIYDRSPYMAHRTAAELAPRIRNLLSAEHAPKVKLFVGHDNNIAALASLLGAKFHVPTYGPEDPPLGGGLGFALLKDKRNGALFVRVFYQAQTLKQLRYLTKLDAAHPPVMQILTPRCARGPRNLCTLKDFARLLTWQGQYVTAAR